MPQVIVDTATESPASLVLLSRLFQDYAMLKAKTEQQAATEYPPQLDAETRSPVPLVSMPTHADSNAEGTAIHAELEADPAKLFGANKPSNVLPFPAATPVTDVAAVTAQAAIPAVATTATPAAAPTPEPATAAAEVPPGTELDSAKVPWDARIHSSAKGKKQDGTWKLARNIDKALVTMVLQEITPKPHVVNGQIVPAGTAAPVVPPVAPPLVPAVPTVPLVPAVGVVPVGSAEVPLNPVQQFQALMKLIAEGQSSSPPKFTHADVLAACVAEGLAQVQLIITAPDKIPAIKARLGLV